MPLVCPQCKQTYEDCSVCSVCNVVLLYHAQNLQPDSATLLPVHEPPQWQQTPWGKIFIGLIMAQGLSHGLRQLLTAWFLAGGDQSDVWDTLWGLVLLHALHGVSLLIGGAITGAGRARGIVFGSLVGLANGALNLFLFSRIQRTSTALEVLAEPLLHMVIGALGGALGMLIWRPAPRIPELELSSTPVSGISLEALLGRLFTGPIHMGRVCAGAFLVVAGVVWSKAILDCLLGFSQGTLTISSHLQAQLVRMEISALIAFLGAAFAGATTLNGFKQGFCVGLGASVVVLGIQLNDPKFVLGSMVFTTTSIIIVTLVGGWFGCRLFPPVLAGKRKRHLSYY